MKDIQKNEAGAEAIDASTKDLIPCKKNAVLLVDDERAIRRLFQMILGAALPECNVEIAADGAEGLAAFSSVHHSVLVMDLCMPVMDGQTAFIKIQELCDAKGWEMPSVVFCTGFAPPDVVRRVVDEDSRHCLLSKPVTGDFLADIVRTKL